MPERRPWTRTEIAVLAASAVAKVDRWGERGATLLSTDEIAAMAAAIALTGACARLLEAEQP